MFGIRLNLDFFLLRKRQNRQALVFDILGIFGDAKVSYDAHACSLVEEKAVFLL